MSEIRSADIERLLAALAAEGPAFHLGGRERWDVSPGTLRLLDSLLSPALRTLEVGVGVSTVVFAAHGTDHRAISPALDEFEAVQSWCADHEVDTARIEFLEGLSDSVLPGLTRQVDLALIDGAHAFPLPVVDFHFVRRLVKVGGVLVLDDLPIPSMGVVYEFLRGEPNWTQLGLADHRAAAFRRTAPDPAGDPWGDQAFNRSYPDYSFLPVAERVTVTAGSYLAHSPFVKRVRARFPAVQRLVPAARKLLR